MRFVPLMAVFGATLIPAASARPANCRPQRPTTTSEVSSLITTSVAGVETSITDIAPTTLTTTNVIDTTNTESATDTSNLISKFVTTTSGLTTTVETTIAKSASDTTTLLASATATTEATPTELSVTESTTADQTSSAGTTTVYTTTAEQTTDHTTTSETTTTAEIPTTTTAAPEATKALQNGGFEDVTGSPWTINSAQFTNDPGLARSGSKFAQINVQNAQASGTQRIDQITSTSKTKQYTLSFYATILSTPNMVQGSACYVYALQDTSFITSLSLDPLALNTYTHSTITFTPYNDNFVLHLNVRCGRGPPTTFSVAIDDVSILEVV
ncbi:hypothetical protein ACHAP8_009217 [Fusarium lateritium]